MHQDHDREECPLEGRYANYFEIGHNAFEFVLDFGQLHAEKEYPAFHTRIITGPAYAKALFRTLGSAIEAFDKAYGAIRDEEGNQSGGT